MINDLGLQDVLKKETKELLTSLKHDEKDLFLRAINNLAVLKANILTAETEEAKAIYSRDILLVEATLNDIKDIAIIAGSKAFAKILGELAGIAFKAGVESAIKNNGKIDFNF